MYQQGELDPLIKERKLRRLNSGGETETIRTKADLEAAFEAGLIETVRREAAAVFGANQTYPCGDVMAMKAEIDRLRAEVERLRAGGCARDQSTTQYCAEAARLAAENEKMRAALREAFEIYANMDGFIPETAGEGYVQEVIKEMVDCINSELAGSPLETGNA